VANRIQVYGRETRPVVEYYRDAGKLREVDGEASIQSVGDALFAAVSA
jgi:adenylate kinase family enzyme